MEETLPCYRTREEGMAESKSASLVRFGAWSIIKHDMPLELGGVDSGQPPDLANEEIAEAYPSLAPCPPGSPFSCGYEWHSSSFPFGSDSRDG